MYNNVKENCTLSTLNIKNVFLNLLLVYNEFNNELDQILLVL